MGRVRVGVTVQKVLCAGAKDGTMAAPQRENLSLQVYMVEACEVEDISSVHAGA
jgi:hypothetical protein